MNKIAVIGLNNFGLEIARELSLGSCSVTVIDKDIKKIDKIASLVTDTILINDWQVASLHEISFDQYDMVILAISGKLDLALGTLIHLKSTLQGNVIVCVENDDEAMIADLFTSHKGWKQLRLDKVVADKLKEMIG